MAAKDAEKCHPAPPSLGGCGFSITHRRKTKDAMMEETGHFVIFVRLATQNRNQPLKVSSPIM